MIPTSVSSPAYARQWVAAFVLCAASVPGLAAAQSAGEFAQEELRALPRVCHAQKFIHAALRPPIVSEAERQLWEQRLGANDYLAFHHYCWGLIFIRRAAAARLPHVQAHNYNQAIANFAYVQRNSSEAFPLLPEVNLRKGQTHRLLGENGAAAKEFLDAIRLKPDYTPAYAALSEVYVDLDDFPAAERVLAQGLEQAPTSELLHEKKLELEAMEKSRK